MSDELRAYARTAVRDVKAPLYAYASTGVGGDVVTADELPMEWQGIQAGR
jgi:hypothetical protein